jgi:hypothetical protein
MRKIFVSIMLIMSFFLSIEAYMLPHMINPSPPKVYLNSDEVDLSSNIYRIHIGQNIWIESSIIHCDQTGMYTFESDILRSPSCDYEKKWKCPYCYEYWPIGKTCQNKDCPSKYKTDIFNINHPFKYAYCKDDSGL